MKRSLETNIRFKAILIYVMAALLCGAVIIYIYHLSHSIQDRRDKLTDYYVRFAETENIVNSVNYVQEEANLYVSTKKQAHLRNFRDKLRELSAYADTVHLEYPNTLRDSIVTAISGLLAEKERIVAELGGNLGGISPLDTVNVMLSAIEPSQITDTLVIRSTTVTDTVVTVAQKQEKKRRRRKDPEPTDTLLVTKSTVDTMHLESQLHYQVVSQASGIVERATREYSARIGAIERNIYRLIKADQEISSNITRLLIRLYTETVRDNYENIRKRESEVRYITVLSILGSIVALALILIFIILIINDVNKGKTAREALQEANERTRQIMESRHHLLLSVSHDIKTPLNSILGYLEMSGSGKRLSGKEIAAMQSSGKHITALLENLLEFSSLEKGSLEKEEQPFYLSELCDELVEIFIPLAARKSLHLETSFDFDAGLRLIGDGLKIKQIAANILSNAVKYTTRGSVRLDVSWDGSDIRFFISDTGAGIPADHMDDIFKPFSRVTQNNALAKGSGFGLYVVKGLTELLGGTIYVESEEGKGTRVTVTLPAAATGYERATVPRKKIAVIDDDIPLMAVICDMCLRLGHECTVTDTLAAAKTLINDLGSYDLVITDMEMGRTSGKDVLEWIRRRGYEVPVIIMTGRSDFNKTKAAEAGFDGYLGKPVTISSLMEVVGETEEARATGNHHKTAKPHCPTPANTIEEMFGDDEETLREITDIFAASSRENLAAIGEAVEVSDFASAQALCHKMLSMFMQMGADERTVALLRKMDASRGKSAFTYPAWKKDMTNLIGLASRFIAGLGRE